AHGIDEECHAVILDAAVAVFDFLVEGKAVLKPRTAPAGDEYAQLQFRIILVLYQLVHLLRRGVGEHHGRRGSRGAYDRRLVLHIVPHVCKQLLIDEPVAAVTPGLSLVGVFPSESRRRVSAGSGREWPRDSMLLVWSSTGTLPSGLCTSLPLISAPMAISIRL